MIIRLFNSIFLFWVLLLFRGRSRRLFSINRRLDTVASPYDQFPVH